MNNNDFDQDEMNESEEPTTSQKMKEWVQENLRVIVSVLVVFLIAFSIYSYSKRGTETTEVAEDTSDIENILTDLSGDKDTDSKEEVANTEEVAKTDENAAVATEDKKEEPKQEVAPQKEEAKQNVSEAKETDSSFVEVAQRGEGTTHLARRALAHYLETNNDASLTAEHKIYIEDYLRKNISQKGGLLTGSSVEFSKDLIKQAIESSKKLNESQLKNLQKYSAHVNF